jgi:PBSX family phage portal protein
MMAKKKNTKSMKSQDSSSLSKIPKPNKMNVRIIKAESDYTRESTNSEVEDFFKDKYESHKILEPPYNLDVLTTMRETCSELGPAIDAMVVNIEKIGYTIKSKENSNANKDNEVSPAVKKEIFTAQTFFDNAVLDQEIGTWEELKSRLRSDLELTGNAYMESIPNAFDPNEPAGVNHLQSWTMRLTKVDDEYTTYEIPRSIRKEDGSYEMRSYYTRKKFRRFVQMDEASYDCVYFKEWGDPRNISSVTGEELPDGETENLAHEVVHLKNYSARSPYGIPRWIGHLFAIYGTRAAQEINFVTLDNNQIPAMALLATNVNITDGSINRMSEFIEERVQGNKNYATILMIEAEPQGEGLKDPASMKLDLKPLTEFQHTDGMFNDYIATNNDMIRRSFRLPPIYVGRADDYNRAVAEASKKLAEEQIFMPERKAMDKLLTDTFLNRLELPNVAYVSNKPNVTDNYELTQLLATAERSGGLTPRISRRITADVFNQELPDVDDSINPDVPLTYTMNERNNANKLEIAKLKGNGLKML